MILLPHSHSLHLSPPKSYPGARRKAGPRDPNFTVLGPVLKNLQETGKMQKHRDLHVPEHKDARSTVTARFSLNASSFLLPICGPSNITSSVLANKVGPLHKLSCGLSHSLHCCLENGHLDALKVFT